MRVALNVSILQAPRTGIGEYCLQLGQHLHHEGLAKLALFDGWRWREDFPQAALPGYSRVSRLAKAVLPGAYGLRRYLQQRCFSRGARQAAAQLYHEPSLWPLRFDGPMVMTLHDLTHVHYPQTQPRDRLREIERRLPDGLQQAARILVDSQAVADEASRYYGIPAERLQVAPLGYAERFQPRSVAQLRPALHGFSVEPRGYLLCVGTLEPRKNLQQALLAFLGLPAALRERYPLLLVGMPGWCGAALESLLQKALDSGQVRQLGYQDEHSVALLLAGAKALLFPSRYEGFGLPVLEAMASGTPVVACNSAAVAEVAGAAALYAEADDVEGFRQAISLLLEDALLWECQRELGLQRALHFSWARCARITAAVYREACSL